MSPSSTKRTCRGNEHKSRDEKIRLNYLCGLNMITRILGRKSWQEGRDAVMAQGLNHPLLPMMLEEFPSQQCRKSLEVGEGKEMSSA